MQAALWLLVSPWLGKREYLAARATGKLARRELPDSLYLTRLQMTKERFPGSVSCIDATDGRLAVGYYVRNKRWRLAIRDRHTTIHLGPPYNPPGGGISISHVALHPLGDLYYAIALHPALNGEWQHRLCLAGVAQRRGAGQVQGLAALAGGGCCAAQERHGERSVVVYDSSLQPMHTHRVAGFGTSLCPGGPHWLDLHHTNAVWRSLRPDCAAPTSDEENCIARSPPPHWHQSRRGWSVMVPLRPSEAAETVLRCRPPPAAPQALALRPAHRMTALYHSETLVLTADMHSVIRLWSAGDLTAPVCTLRGYRGAPLLAPVQQRFVCVPQRNGNRLLLLDVPSGQWVALQLRRWGSQDVVPLVWEQL
jgi:hypothetical protein